MNIPDITNELQSGFRSQSIVPTGVAERPPVDGSARISHDAPQKQNKGNRDKEQSHNFSKEELNTLIVDAEKALEAKDVNLKFNVLEENDTVQVEIVDAEGKTIRKIPGDDLLKLSKSLKNLERGFLDKIS